jgi:hypothetical protein
MGLALDVHRSKLKALEETPVPADSFEAAMLRGSINWHRDCIRILKLFAKQEAEKDKREPSA